MVVLEFAIFPTDRGEAVTEYVARALDIIDKSGLSYQFTPMGTIIEGEWNAAMAVVTACYEALKPDCHRIYTTIKIDYRAGQSGRLTSKIRSVESNLGRTLLT